MTSNNDPEIFTTGPISVPVVIPELETVPMNGFAWSADLGLLVAAGTNDDIDKFRLREELYGWWKRPGD